MKIQQPIKMWMVQEDRYYDYIARAGRCIDFQIDARWPGLKGNIAVKVTYRDEKSGTLQLAYNGGQSIKEHALLGDGKLKTTTFMLAGLKPKRMEHDFDFVLQAGESDREITVSMVRAIAVK